MITQHSRGVFDVHFQNLFRVALVILKSYGQDFLQLWLKKHHMNNKVLFEYVYLHPKPLHPSVYDDICSSQQP